MPIKTLRPRLPEVGRIRLGEKIALPDEPGKKTGRTRPERLDTLRFTSSDVELLRVLRVQYGGEEPRQWAGAPVGDQFELISESTFVDVFVPPVAMGLSQFMELWEGGGCVRRCDGEVCTIAAKRGDNATVEQVACKCTKGTEQCRPTTRLGLILCDVPSTGMWRLESKGWNAAGELAGVCEMIGAAQLRNGGAFVPGRLRVEMREVKRPGQAVKQFVVPVLEVSTSVEELFPPVGAAGGPVAAIGVGGGGANGSSATVSSGPAPDPDAGTPDTVGICADCGTVADIDRHYTSRRKAGRPCSSDPENDAGAPAAEGPSSEPDPVSFPGRAGVCEDGTVERLEGTSARCSEPDEESPALGAKTEMFARLVALPSRYRRELDEQAKELELPAPSEYDMLADVETREAIAELVSQAEAHWAVARLGVEAAGLVLSCDDEDVRALHAGLALPARIEFVERLKAEANTGGRSRDAVTKRDRARCALEMIEPSEESA